MSDMARAMELDDSYIIVIGNPVEGFEFYGPFRNEADAAKHANSDPHLPDEWWAAPLLAPGIHHATSCA
jgi:hypothetical protein